MSKPGSIAADRLKSFIERVEKLREEKKAIGSDERNVFSEAKGVGFDTKAMREVLKRRAMDDADRDEWDALVDTYEHALGARGVAARMVAEGATYEEAAAKTDVSRATVARTVASRKNLENETPEAGVPQTPNPTEGPEVAGSQDGHEIHRGAMPSKDGAEVMRAELSMSGSAVASGDAVRDASAMPLDVAAAPYSEGREHGGSASSAPPACDPDDDLTLPPFLDRRKQVSA